MIEIEKPQIECVETPGDVTYGKYVVEPLERGYGTTLGNAPPYYAFFSARHRADHHQDRRCPA